jgi:hypothetical protein
LPGWEVRYSKRTFIPDFYFHYCFQNILKNKEMKPSLIVIFLLITTVIFGRQVCASDFKMVKKEGSFTLYERWIKNGSGELVRELKVEFSVVASPADIVSLLKKESLGTGWNNRALRYNILTASTGNRWINYIRYNMPSLMDDQDCCLLFSLHTQNDSFYRINFESVNSAAYPTTSGVTRLSGVRGEWLIRKADSETYITYLISSDRNKNIPRFISDPIVRNNLLTTMKSFKNLLENKTPHNEK